MLKSRSRHISRNNISLIIRRVSFHLNDSEIKARQERDNVCGKNYWTENGIVIIKKKVLRKVIIPTHLRKNCFILLMKILASLLFKKKMLNIVLPNYYLPNMTQGFTEYLKLCDICPKKKKLCKYILLVTSYASYRSIFLMYSYWYCE